MTTFLRLSLILTALLSGISFAQEVNQSSWTENGVKAIISKSTEAQLVNNASMYTQEGYLYFAEMIVDRLLEINPDNANYNYRKGFLLLETHRKYNEAIPFFIKATKDTHRDVDMFSTRDKRAPADVFYHLGRCYHYAEQLDSAEVNYQKFLLQTYKKSELIPEAQLRLKQLQVARKFMETPIEMLLKNMGPSINSELPEYSSVISFDGTALYFTSRRPWFNNETEPFKDPKINQYPEDVYVSYLDFDSTWTEPVRLLFCEPNINEATIAVSVDERRIYVYDDQKGGGDLFYSDFKNNRFNELIHLDNMEINTPSWEPHCMVSNDGKYLFFSSDRPGGYGGLDIYVCIKQENGSWGEPLNMGPEINGPFDDDSPFISISNNELYFATNDERSMGGFDIMLARKTADTTWGNPENLGYPFNRTNDDLYYTTTIDGLQGFLTSYRDEGYGEKDLYQVFNNLIEISPTIILDGVIVNEDNTPLPEEIEFVVKVKCLDCPTTEHDRTVFPRVRDGVFMSTLQPCKKYILQYIDLADNKIIGEETFETDCSSFTNVYKRLVLNTKTRELTQEKPIVNDLDTQEVTTIMDINIIAFEQLTFKHYFDYNSNKLKSKTGDLNKFIKAIENQLKQGRKQVSIIINSSASQVPTYQFKNNEELAHLRAENLKYDLINHFQNKKLDKQIIIVIENFAVDGPEYINDPSNHKKYKPYQLVSAKTE